MKNKQLILVGIIFLSIPLLLGAWYTMYYFQIQGDLGYYLNHKIDILATEIIANGTIQCLYQQKFFASYKHSCTSDYMEKAYLDSWTASYIEYKPAVILHDPSQTLETMTGDCDDIAVLTCAMYRSKGYPCGINFCILGDCSSVDLEYGLLPAHTYLIDNESANYYQNAINLNVVPIS